MKIRDIAVSGLLLAASLIIFIIENQIPVPIPIPGFKLGLSNIITLVVLIMWDKKHAFIILLMRIILSSIICGSGVAVLYSLIGGMTCFVSICVATKFIETVPAISVIGAIFHNIGQLFVACFILKSFSALVYLPHLTVFAIITGLFTGFISLLMIKNKHIQSLFKELK